VIVAVLGFVFLQSGARASYECLSLLTPGPVQPVPTPRPDPATATQAPSLPATTEPSVAPSLATTLAPSAAPTVAPSVAASTAPASGAPSALASSAALAPASVGTEPSSAPTVSPGPEATPSPSPSPTPEPQPTQQLGFVTQDLGKNHVSESRSVGYEFCPPTSGEHYSSDQAPLRRDFYGPTVSLGPGNWIHNLEHGYVALLYRDDPGPQVLAERERIVEEVPGGAAEERCGYAKVIAVRFDDMSVPFAAAAWDRALLLEEFDADQLMTFAEQWQDGPVTPEQGLC
jgi:hypothetical protein